MRRLRSALAFTRAIAEIRPVRLAKLRAIVPLALWAWVIWHLRDEWTLNAQYTYGWAVPFLAGFLFHLRWQTRPLATPVPGASRSAQVAVFALLALLLPIRIVEEANPDWRLLSWTLAVIAVAVSLLTIVRVGGRGWLAHFAFPICFPLVAVPWLVQFETVLAHGLARPVASVAVEVAGVLGIAAYQLGNVIQLANGFVGVDEACSGVKTLQAAIMVSLFLGELLRVSWPRRFVLLLIGCAWMFACNILRATTLVVIAARNGIPALHQWHDLVGNAVLIVGLAGLGLAAFALQPKHVRLATAGPRASHASSLWEPAAALVWLALVFGGSELWYRAHERQLFPRPIWEPHWPVGYAAYRPLSIDESTRAILRYNDASSATWEEPQSVRWWGFFSRWQPQRTALQLVRSHSPDICLPAIGRTFRGRWPNFQFEEGSLHLPFRSYEFVQQSQPLFVFVCIQDDKSSRPEPSTNDFGEWSSRSRLRAAWNGQRNLGQRLLELAVVGLPDYKAARDAAEALIRQILVTTASTGSRPE
ncbi:MAG TPA: exosortase/archaeosortase family protein [Chthoniobacterales bacterium]|nr:exosortase/archaeosortase family protein [Chthoniobacterales bacterium]